MSDKVVELSKFSQNAAHRNPEQLLEEVLEYVREGAFKGFKKMLVLTLDEEDEQYKVYWCQAGMNMSQCLTLCEVGKVEFLKQMNYIPKD